MKKRIEKLVNCLPCDVDAVLVTSATNMRYLTNFNSDGAGMVLVTRNKAFFITDSRYIEAAKRCENERLDVILHFVILSGLW